MCSQCQETRLNDPDVHLIAPQQLFEGFLPSNTPVDLQMIQMTF